MKKSEVSLKANLDFAGALKCLEDLVASFKEKTVCVSRGEHCVVLKPGEHLELELEAACKKGKQKLSLELSWVEEIAPCAPQEFAISAKEPEPVVEPEPEIAAEPAAETAAPCPCLAPDEPGTELKPETKKGKPEKK